MQDTNTHTPSMFAAYAQDSYERWAELVSLTVEHSSFGMGVVDFVYENHTTNAIYVQVTFDSGLHKFNVNVFVNSRYIKDLILPSHKLEQIQELISTKSHPLINNNSTTSDIEILDPERGRPQNVKKMRACPICKELFNSEDMIPHLRNKHWLNSEKAEHHTRNKSPIHGTPFGDTISLEALEQSFEDRRDASRGWGNHWHDHDGTFGSFPVHDDHGDESDPY